MVDVWTARIDYRGSDALDVSRKGKHQVGLVFAPSWDLLHPVIEQRRAGFPITEEGWQQYIANYTAEMRVSYVCNRSVWTEVLSREVVTFTCFCTDPARCHRSILASLFASLAANVCGERAKTPKTETLQGIE